MEVEDVPENCTQIVFLKESAYCRFLHDTERIETKSIFPQQSSRDENMSFHTPNVPHACDVEAAIS